MLFSKFEELYAQKSLSLSVNGLTNTFITILAPKLGVMQAEIPLAISIFGIKGSMPCQNH